MRTTVVAQSLLALVGIVALCSRREAHAPAPAAVAPPVPWTIALVYPAWELWIGNDEVARMDPEDPTRMPGALKTLEAALDRAALSRNTPPGSQGLVVSYGDRPVLRVARGPIARLDGRALGTQDDYYGQHGFALVASVELALDQLEHAPPGHRRLVLVSDGGPTIDDVSEKLDRLRVRAARLGVEVSSITYTTMSCGSGVVRRLAEPVRATTLDELDQAVVLALRHATS